MKPALSSNQIDYKTFIKFHPSCSGNDGRIVYIDPNLLVRFAELIDPASNTGLQAVQGMVGLKNSAAGISSDSNQSCAMQHRATCGNVLVTYCVLQNGGRGPGVYVTNLQQAHGKDRDRPGLYKVTPSVDTGRPWDAKEDPSPTLTTSVGVVGSVPPTGEQNTGATDTANIFASSVLKGERRAGKGFSLFYTPSYVVDGLGVWLTADQKNPQYAGDCARKLAQILVNTAKKAPNPGDPERFKWYIVGHGVQIFQQAFAEYKASSREPLGKRHEIYFVDPQGPLGGFSLQDQRDHMLDLNRDNLVLSNTMGLASRLHQIADPTESYVNFYRNWERFRNVNQVVEKGKNIYKNRFGGDVYFSDLINSLKDTLVVKGGLW